MLLSAGLRALNRAGVGLTVSMSMFYLVALPSGYYMTFHTSIGVYGLILGPMAGYYMMAFLFLIYYCAKLDWN